MLSKFTVTILNSFFRPPPSNNNITANQITEEILFTRHNTVLFYSNWSDSINFPSLYGTGQIVSGIDTEYSFIDYISALNNKKYYGIINYKNRKVNWLDLAANSDLPIMESHLVDPNGSNTIKINLQNNTTVERVQVTLASLIDLQISGMTVRAGAYNTVEIILSKTYSGTIRVNVLYYKT